VVVVAGKAARLVVEVLAVALMEQPIIRQQVQEPLIQVVAAVVVA